MTFTLEDIEDAWADYKSRKVIKFLKDGVEKFQYLEGQRVETRGLTNARAVSLESVISFPAYLRTKWTKS